MGDGFSDPDREVQQQYLLVYIDDTKFCPKSVQQCEQCCLAFYLPPEFLVVKTVGVQERTEKLGKKKYSENIYIHFV